MRRLSGIALIVVSAISFGTLAILGRYAYGAGLDTVAVLFYRFILSAGLMAVLMVLRREPFPRGRVLLQLVGMGAVGYVCQAYAYLSALRYASAGLVALLLYLYPGMVAVLSAVLLRERISALKIVALGMALAGTGLAVGPAGGQLVGILLALGSAAIYSAYIIVGAGVMKQVSAIQSSTVIFSSAGLVFGVWMAASGGVRVPQTGEAWLAVMGMVLLATVLPVVTFLAGLERVGPTNASMLSTLEPAVTVLLAAWLLGEHLKPVSLLGGALILAAVLLLSYGELRSGKGIEARPAANGAAAQE